jgi:hypothetical protein
MCSFPPKLISDARMRHGLMHAMSEPGVNAGGKNRRLSIIVTLSGGRPPLLQVSSDRNANSFGRQEASDYIRDQFRNLIAVEA